MTRSYCTAPPTAVAALASPNRRICGAIEMAQQDGRNGQSAAAETQVVEINTDGRLGERIPAEWSNSFMSA